MCREKFCAAVLLLSLTGVCAAATYVVPTTTLTAQTANNTSAANSFSTQTNGNSGTGNVSKVDVHSLLYSGATSKGYAHLVLWFGGSNHMNVGYSSADAVQVHKQITDMISRGVDGVILDWYGPNNSIDQAAKPVMAEAENHPGFTFAIMIDQGAIKSDSCSGCTPQQALISQLQYIEHTYFPSPAYMTWQGQPVITNFNVDLSYSVDWNAANAALSTHPVFLSQNNDGFSHTLSDGSYAWVMPTTTDYGKSYLSSLYNAGMLFPTQQVVGATYKGFNDSLASWGSNRVMSQQCGQTWLQTFSDINGLYNSGKQLTDIQLVTWNDYEEGTEIESGIDNCVTVSASVAGTVVSWSITGQMNTVDHFSVFASQDGANLMWLADVPTTASSLNLAQFSLIAGNYTIFVKATGEPSLTNKISAGVHLTLSNQPPTVALTISTPSGAALSNGQMTAPVTVTASTAGSTDPDGNIVATIIDFGDGSAPVIATSASHTYTMLGIFTLTATVTDNMGATASKSATIVVSSPNQPPTAVLTVSTSQGNAPVTITASTAGSTDPDGTIVATSINFGDGSAPVIATSASHTYSMPGTFTLTATVTDNMGATASKSATLVVSRANP